MFVQSHASPPNSLLLFLSLPPYLPSFQFSFFIFFQLYKVYCLILLFYVNTFLEPIHKTCALQTISKFYKLKSKTNTSRYSVKGFTSPFLQVILVLKTIQGINQEDEITCHFEFRVRFSLILYLLEWVIERQDTARALQELKMKSFCFC